MNSPIIEFYRYGGVDHKGRTFYSIIGLSDEEYEQCHNFIQWLFPLHEASRMTKEVAPILTKEDSDFLKSDPLCRMRMRLALSRFLTFIADKDESWCKENDHNLLRITRIIRSLRLFGLEENAEYFYNAMQIMVLPALKDSDTLTYWHRALTEPLFNTLY